MGAIFPKYEVLYSLQWSVPLEGTQRAFRPFVIF